jgi:hypothetical protein
MYTLWTGRFPRWWKRAEDPLVALTVLGHRPNAMKEWNRNKAGLNLFPGAQSLIKNHHICIVPYIHGFEHYFRKILGTPSQVPNESSAIYRGSEKDVEHGG